MAEAVKLFSLTGSPYGCRAEIGLKLKGIQYEFIEESISNKSPLLLKYNPVHKKVPVLLHKGKPICESLVILEYIDETWKGAPILPDDPYDRAMARFWAKFIDDKVPVLRNAFMSQGEQQEKAIEEGTEVLNKLENELKVKGKKFFGGDTIGLVDIAAVFIGFWLGILEEVTEIKLLSKEKHPKLSEWVDDFLSCSAVKESVPPRDHLVGYFRGRFGKA